VRNSIQQLRTQGRTVLLCTHNLYEAEELADQVAIIRLGRIIMNDTLESVKQQLLGPVEYEARLACQLDGLRLDLPSGVELRSRGENWLRFYIQNPDVDNARLLRFLLDAQLPVVSFQEVPRSLEKAFLSAIGSPAVDVEEGDSE
jgi:ABC-2 type transport system ATP-binding protein